MAKKKTTPSAEPPALPAPPKPNNPHNFLERVNDGFYGVERNRPEHPRIPTDIPYPQMRGSIPQAVATAIDEANRQQKLEYESAKAEYDEAFAAWQKVGDATRRMERVDSAEWLRVCHGVVSDECPLYQAIYEHTRDYRNEHCPDEDFWVTLDKFLSLLYSREIRILVQNER